MAVEVAGKASVEDMPKPATVVGVDMVAEAVASCSAEPFVHPSDGDIRPSKYYHSC